jgi:phage gpG-like protein
VRNFDSIGQFIRFLDTRAVAVHKAQHDGLAAAGDLVVADARSRIGTYQEQAGPFAAWQDLAETTLYGGYNAEGRWFPGKVQMGYAPPDNPLLRTGALRASIEREVTQNEVVVGSHDPIAPEQEFGTHHIPPRSFIGAAMFQCAHEATHVVVHHIMNAFVGAPAPRPTRHHDED